MKGDLCGKVIRVSLLNTKIGGQASQIIMILMGEGTRTVLSFQCYTTGDGGTGIATALLPKSVILIGRLLLKFMHYAKNLHRIRICLFGLYSHNPSIDDEEQDDHYLWRISSK